MEEMLLADKYARALIYVAQEADLIDQLDKELAMFEAILERQSELREILRSPLISFEEKRRLLETTFKGQWISQELASFLFLLLKMRRLHLFGEINTIYKDLIYSLRKRLKIFVESAFALDAKEKNALKKKFSRIYQKKVDLFVRVNPALIGGARIYVGHKLYDGTVKRRLAFLRESICKE